MAMITDASLALETEADGLAFAREVLRIEADALERVRGRLNITITRAAELVYRCTGTVFVTGMGKTGIVGQKLAATMASTGTRAFHLHPAGHSLALVARGQLFAMALWEGAQRRFSTDPGAGGRIRHGQWLGDGSTLVAVSDSSSEERIVAFAGHEAKVLPWDCGHVTRLRAAPQGSCVAFANHRNEVWIGDVASGELHAVDRSDDGRSPSPATSTPAFTSSSWYASILTNSSLCGSTPAS